MLRVNASTVVKHGSSRGAVRCAAVPVGHLDHAASVYTHTSTAPSTELVTYIGDYRHFPKPFRTLPSPELFQLADLGDKNDEKIWIGRGKVRKDVDDNENKALAQLKNQNGTPDQKFAAVQRR